MAGVSRGARSQVKHGASIMLYSLVGAVAVAAMTRAVAQESSGEAAFEGEEIEEIQVTASRIRRDGFSAPTPTTVISSDELRMSGSSSLGPAMADIPQVRPGITQSTAQGTRGSVFSGFNTVDLRGLGPQRTLVLLDGVRQVRTSPATTLNFNTLPFALVDRTEIVTGGASAAWGSDAVAGVINVALNDRLEGLHVNSRYGVSTRGDGEEYGLDLAFGLPFAGGRGRLVVGGEYWEDRGIDADGNRERGWSYRWDRVNNPDPDGADFIVVPGVTYNNMSEGGLITGVAGGASESLVGQQFDTDGALSPFHFGSIQSGVLQVGGDGVHLLDESWLASPLTRASAALLGTYDLLDNVQVRTSLLFADTTTNNMLFPLSDESFRALTIQHDNAFLHPDIAAMMPPGSSFRLGRFNSDIHPINNSIDLRTLQGVIAFRGNLGDRWQWDTHYTRGRADLNTATADRLNAQFLEALDSVIHPETGEPVCRSALTVPNTACAPLNVFGLGNASQAAIDYFSGDVEQDIQTTLDNVAAAISGEPFSNWAGPVSMAFGLEWRREESEIKVDALSRNFRWRGLNPQALSGSIRVSEGFVESIVPLLGADAPLIDALELNAAVRISDYSQSGSVTTWKIGSNLVVNDSLRLRATQSRDIREPNIQELFAPDGRRLGTVIDPATGQPASISANIASNPDLVPEEADTLVVGAVYSPSWLQGLTLSVDYYSIDIGNAIERPTVQQIVDDCHAGNPASCDLVRRDEDGNLVSIDQPLQNVAQFEVSGMDFEAVHVTPVFADWLPGRLRTRLLANYVTKYVRGVTPVDLLGELQDADSSGVPRWRASLSTGYITDRFGTDLRLRYVHSGLRSATLPIENNRYPSQLYLDLNLQYRVLQSSSSRPASVTLYGNVRNLLDKAPPGSPSARYHDVIGRYFGFGVRIDL